tara:strand:+ start:2093 stop:2710 length:618 start_codon:yes stop_codon:yes gene_type:complete
MASKQALDGKYTMWFRSVDAVTTAAAPNNKSDCTFDCRFQGLPDCKLYILECEQFSLAGNDTGVEYRVASVGEDATAAGQLVPSGLIAIDGFASLPGAQNWQGNDFLNCRPGVMLSRFSTSPGSGDPDDDCVTPNNTPSSLVYKPQAGQIRVTIGTIYPNSALTDVAYLTAAATDAGPLVAIKDWVLCISLRGIPDAEADRYFAR